MSTDIATLGIKVDSSDVRNASGELRILVEVGQKAEKATDGLKDSFGGLKTALAGLGFGALVREAVQLGDTYSNIQGRLSLVTTGTSELNAVTERLFQSAQRARVGFEATSDLYSSLARSTKTLGTSQGDLLQVTETINKALIVSGASAQTAEGALVQLAQGFASGTLRGDELNAVLEGTPRLAQAIADGMGVTVGQLRSLGSEGKITGETVFNALKTQREAVEKEFAKMPTTVAQSFTVLQNEILKYVGEANKANGATAAMAEGIKLLAGNLDVVVPLVVGVGLALGVGFVTRAVAAQVAAAGAAGGMTAMAAAARVAGASLLSAFGGPVGIAVTGVTLAIGALIAENAKASSVIATVNKSYDEMQKRLQQAKIAADTANGGTKNLSTTVDQAAPGFANLTGNVRLLADQLYRQADAAKKARIEMAVTALAEAKSNEDKAAALTPMARRDNNSRQQLRNGDLLGLASSTYSYVTGSARSLLSGGRTDREAMEAVTKAAIVSRQAREALAAAYKSTNAPIASASAANDAEIKKIKGQIDDLKKLRDDATPKERKRIDNQIANRERKVTLLGTGASEAAVNSAVGSASSGSGGSGKSEKEREYDSAVKSSQNYIDQLRQETDAIGKNQIEQRMADASREAGLAPTAALREAILGEAAAWASATVAQEATTSARQMSTDWLERESRATTDALKSAKEYADQVEFETRLQGMNAQQRATALALRDLETRGVKEGSIAWDTYGKSIVAAAQAKGGLQQQADQANAFADSMRSVNDSVHLATDGFSRLFGTAGEGFATMLTSVTDYSERVAEIESRLADERSRYGIGSVEAARAQERATADLANAETEHYGKMISSVKGFFKEKSTAYKVAEAAEKVYFAVRTAMALKDIIMEGLLTTTKVAGAGARMATDTVETASSVANSGTRAAADGVAAFAKTLASLPFPLNLVAGAAVLAALVGVGVAISGGGGKGSSASASASPEPPKPTDYANQESRYSVLQTQPGYGTQNPNVGTFQPSNQSSAPALSAMSAGLTIKFGDTNINADGANSETIATMREMLVDERQVTIQKTREAVQQDRVNNGGRQFIGGGVN